MRKSRLPGALMIGVLLASLSGPVAASALPAANLQRGSVPRYVESDRDAALTAVEVFVPAGLERETPATNGVAAVAVRALFQTGVTNGSSSSPRPLEDAIEAAGGTVDSDIEGRWTRISIVGRSEAIPSFLGMLAQALAAPDLSATNVDAARRFIARRLGEIERDPLAVGVEMFRRSYYLDGNGLPTLGSASVVARLTPDDVRTFFGATYARDGAHVAIVGRSTPAIGQAVDVVEHALHGQSLPPVAAKTRPFSDKPLRVVTHRDVGEPMLVVGFAAPSPNSRDFAAMLVINAVLTSGLQEPPTVISELPTSIGSYYLYESAPATLAVYINGARVDPTLGLSEVITVASSLSGRDLNDAALNKFKSIARGSMLMSTLSLSDRASVIGALAVGADDPLNAVIDQIAAVNAGDVRRVAKQYLHSYTVARSSYHALKPAEDSAELRATHSDDASTLDTSLRVALVHDYLNQRGGAERVFARFADAFPQAPIYTALLDRSAVGDLFDLSRVRVSWLQRIPDANRRFRYLAPLYPLVFERFDLRSYDVVVSSTTAWAKGIRVRPDATHVCYIATVSRFAYDYDGYVGEMLGRSPLRWIARPIVAGLSAWDHRVASRPTAYIANSHNVARRVERCYGRRAYVLHPPIELERFSIGAGRGDYVMTVARLLPYKRIDLAIRACAAAGVRLRVVGEGPMRAELERIAAGTATEFCGAVGDRALGEMMRDALAVVVPGEEDFGLVPLEAAACGRPTLAFGRGGALETIVPGVTGEHFPQPTPESLAALLRGFDPRRYDPAVMRAHAESFGPAPFVARLRALVARIRTLPHGDADPRPRTER